MNTRARRRTEPFISWRGGRLSRNGVYHILDHLSDVAGVENVRRNLHALRRTFAQDIMEAGADVNQVSQMLNHSTQRCIRPRDTMADLPRRHSSRSMSNSARVPPSLLFR
jgi:integrase